MGIIQRKKSNRGELWALAVLAALVIIAALAAGSIGDRGGDEAAKNVELALGRAVARCYAVEGAYPPDLDYIREHYGVDPDPGRYIVHYEYVASNLMPSITVIPADPGGRQRNG